MKASEYIEYQRNFAAFMLAESLRNLTSLEDCHELYISNRPCDACKGLPGSRYDANGYIKAVGKVSEVYSICQDCVYYAEYGRLDDMTMAGMENDLPATARDDAHRSRDDAYSRLCIAFGITSAPVFVSMTATNERGIQGAVEYVEYIAAVQNARFYDYL